MAFIIIKTNSYYEHFNRLPPNEQERIKRLLHQLAEYGRMVGQPIRFPFFREKKFNGNRMYFLVYDDWKAILLVMFSNKKEQPEVIEEIIRQLPAYKELVRAKLLEAGII